MKNLILTLLATALGLMTMAQVGTIENITVEQRADGSGMVDISFDLTGPGTNQYNISIESSFNGGDTYTPVSSDYLSGDIARVSPATGLEIVWDGMASHPDIYSEEAMLKIVASLAEDNGNGHEPGTITDIDGNVYTTVIIGNQEWMAENLRSTIYKDTTNIPTGYSVSEWLNLTTGAYGVYPHVDIDGLNSDAEVLKAYGALYNWYAVETGNLCPYGWRVPSNDDWTTLINYVVDQGYPNDWDEPNGTGKALKSCRQVNHPDGGDCATSEHPRWNSHSTHYGTDEFGFSALPGGRRFNQEGENVGNWGSWWSSSSYDTSLAWRQTIYYDLGNVNSYYFDKRIGFSIRCIKDSDVPPVHSLNLQVYPEGSGEVVGTGEYLEGTLVNISVSPNPGYTFVNWTGDTSYIADANAASTILTMPAQDVTLTANFEEDGGGNGEPGTGVTDIDGNFYPSVIIGNQEWMAENLKTTKYRNDSPIDYPGTDNTAWQNNTTGAYAWYDNDIGWKDSYGALYNWHAVNNSNGLCPNGWHVPSDADWTQLVDYIVAQGHPNHFDSPNGVGNALKSCRQVNSPLGGNCNTSAHPRWNSDVTHHGFDEFGFSSLPGGGRWSDGGFLFIGSSGHWHSSSESSSTNAWDRYMSSPDGALFSGNYGKLHGFSVRCFRDID